MRYIPSTRSCIHCKPRSIQRVGPEDALTGVSERRGVPLFSVAGVCRDALVSVQFVHIRNAQLTVSYPPDEPYMELGSA